MLKDETEILTYRKMGAPEILKQYFNDFGMQLHQQDIENLKVLSRESRTGDSSFEIESFRRSQ